MTLYRSPLPRLGAPALAALVLASALAVLAPSHAGTVQATPATLLSTADRMISYRHQEHMWVTDDGVFQLITNRGAQPTGDALQLYSSADGVSWKPQLTLADTGDKSTSDGSLKDGLLSVVYSGTANDIRFAPLRYDSSTQSWKLKGSGQVVRAAKSKTTATNPSLVEDRNGNFWVAFVEQDNRTGTSVIVLYYRANGSKEWINTGVTFGPQDDLSSLTKPKRSARLVLTPTGIGVVYAVREGIYWQQRFDGGTPQDPWQAAQTLDAGDPDNPDTDPMSSHFSVATDPDGFLHMALVNGGIPYYMRYNAQPTVLAWSYPAIPMATTSINAGYPQMSSLGGKQIAMVVNAGASVRVYQSASRGAQGSFVCSDRLVHPQATPENGLNFDHPRIETPSQAPTSFVPVLQQYTYTDLFQTEWQLAYAYRFSASASAGCQ